MTNEALINKIKSWLEDEEVAELEMYTKKSIRDQPDPDYYIEFKFKRVKISLIFPYNKDDNFNVVTRNHLSKDLLRVQRDRYDTDLLKKIKLDHIAEFLTYPTHYDLIFDVETVLLVVGFLNTLWEDGLNKNLFFQTLMNVAISGYKGMNYLNRLFY